MQSVESPIKAYERYQDRHLAIRIDLRAARGDLARHRRSLMQILAGGGKSARERERHLEFLVGENPEILHLETTIASLENDEDEVKTAIEKINFGLRQQEWLIRNKMADAICEFSRLQNPALQALGSTVFEMLSEEGRFGSESEFIEEQLVGQ